MTGKRGVNMRFLDIIVKKREGKELSTEEIWYWIKTYVAGDIPDYQVSSLLMAIVLNGMNARETKDLTLAMMHSGEVIDLSSIKGIKVDKHSTGGVGDKTSLALGPMAAACGAKLAKMSGRGLGHTGGTLDKLESIPGFNCYLDKEQFVNQVNDINIAIIGQTSSLVPADKKLYALRDVTATVDSIPLIASSIMSKKLAAGSDAILLDVKYGDGAFMKTPEDAIELAQSMIDIGTALGRSVRAMITDMNQPLGKAIGNALEVKEAVATLKGNGPGDFTQLCVAAGSNLLVQARIAKDVPTGKAMILQAIDSGRAFEMLKTMVRAQGGDDTVLDNVDLLPKAKYITPLQAGESGCIQHLNALSLGILAMKIGAGRETAEDVINPGVGIVLEKKEGDYVVKGDVLAYIHHDDVLEQDWLNDFYNSYCISQEKGKDEPLIYKIIS